MNTLHTEFKSKLREISSWSNKINKKDRSRIFELIKQHIQEVEELYKKNNEHWTIETADLIVLCYELLILENKDIDEVFAKCLPRYDIKLKRLAEDAN